ncbi:hypothetical protein N9924_00990 [bacterium]|nr:hypothetical protein [bacterium]
MTKEQKQKLAIEAIKKGFTAKQLKNALEIIDRFGKIITTEYDGMIEMLDEMYPEGEDDD